MVSARPTLTGERKISIFFPRRRSLLCAPFVHKHGHIESYLKIPIVFKPLSLSLSLSPG